MAASVHYIRTIHTSFTAAHPHSSSAWASASHASTTSVARAQAHSNLLHALTGNAQLVAYPPPSLSVSKYSPALGTPTGRKRSASIRVAPPAYVQRMQSQLVKFDPFADDLETSASPSSILYHSAIPPTARSTTTRPATIPYTIQLTPAASTDNQKLHHHQSHQHMSRQPRTRVPSPPLQVQVQAPSQQQPQSVQRVPTPAIAATTPSPAAIANARKEKEARSRIVAGILLNRVHAVGKPLRRRGPVQPRTYVPSSLSTCISVDA